MSILKHITDMCLFLLYFNSNNIMNNKEIKDTYLKI